MRAASDWQTELVEVADGVFAYIQANGGLCISNAGFIVGDDDVLIVDTLFTRPMNHEFQAQIRRVTSKPARHLVNTHHHVDHTLGNALFPDSCIVAHRMAEAMMGRMEVPGILPYAVPHFAADIEGVPVRMPDIAFEGSLEFDLGGRRVQLFSFAPGHTASDVVAYLPREKVLFAGDLAFYRVTPVTLDGHVSGWIRSLDRILRMDIDVVVPGHGPIGDLEDLQLVRAYLALLRRQARRAHARGLTVEEAVAGLRLGEYAAWREPERAIFAIARLYREFAGKI